MAYVSDPQLAALQLECEALERRLAQARRDDGAARLRRQVQELELHIHELEERQRHTRSNSSEHVKTAPLERQEEEEGRPRLSASATTELLSAIVQQNNLLRELVHSSRERGSSVHSAARHDLPGAIAPDADDLDGFSSHDSPARSPSPIDQPTRSGTRARLDSAGERPPRTPSLASRPPPRQPTPLAMPDVVWTAEDEERLWALENGAMDEHELDAQLQELAARADSPAPAASLDRDAAAVPDTASAAAHDDERERKRIERNEGRKRMAELLSASASSGSSVLRRPRWRLEMEAEAGVLSRCPGDAESVMPARQVFRSAVRAVMALRRIEALFLERRAEAKDLAMQTFEAMLVEYFDVTRGWLARVVRTPLLSVLQDESLDMNVGGESALGEAPRGRGLARRLASWLRLRGPASPRVAAAAADPATLLKLKVRVKAVIDTLVRAVDKREIPAGILDFLRRMTSDGVYFPPSYQLFALERQVLAFDALGATRWMEQDGSCPDLSPPSRPAPTHTDTGAAGDQSSSAFPRFHVVVANFLLLRVLLPHVVARPWLAGICRAGQSKRVRANLRSMATLLYLVCARLSPLPSLADLRRQVRGAAAATSALDPPPAAALASGAADAAASASASASAPRFLSIDEIGRELALGFPSDGPLLAVFIADQQAKLSRALRQLQTQMQTQTQTQTQLRAGDST